MKLSLPRTRAGRIILALVLLNELRGVIVVCSLLILAGRHSP